MALTLNQLKYDVWGSTPVSVYTAQPAAADYPTGGYAITAQQLGLGGSATILSMNAVASAKNSTPVTTTVVLAWDRVNQKLQAFESAAESVSAQPLAEVANDGDLSGWLFTIQAIANP